jgi:hypothetical protein
MKRLRIWGALAPAMSLRADRASPALQRSICLAIQRLNLAFVSAITIPQRHLSDAAGQIVAAVA